MQVSFWEKQSFFAHRDIIIVGAGLAGLWSAYELYKKDPALKILIVEKGTVPAGASTRNAGFACFGSPTELLNDCRLLGEDKMWEIAEMRYKGLEKTKAHFKPEVIDFDNCGGCELISEYYKGMPDLNEALGWLNKGLKGITGLEQTFMRSDEKLGLFNFKGFAGLVENALEGGLHSGKLVQELTRKVLALGVDIINSTEITGWESGENGASVITARGQVLNASKLLFCTNAFTRNLVKEMNVTPARGQILLTAPLNGLGFKGTFHYDEGYYYFRNVGKRVLIGGARNKAMEEETTTELETTDIIQNELEGFLQKHILHGQGFKVEQRWSGIMGFTASKLPEARQVTTSVYCLITCNGMGVALAPIMAEKAAELVLR